MNLNKVAEQIYQISLEHGFWSPVESGDFEIEHFYCTKIALIHSEASECLEAIRTDNWDKVPEELADIIIRVLDLAAGMGYDLEDVIIEKIKANAQRPFLHGKSF